VALLYADEGFPRGVTELLRQSGHDVLTVQEAGQANQRIPDDQVLAFATGQGRAVLTINRVDFIRLHRMSSDHAGIIACTEDLDRQRLATQIHEAIVAEASLAEKLIRINRPSAEKRSYG
jgi:predicted nuclease of predicted toxin-antitoxin system